MHRKTSKHILLTTRPLMLHQGWERYSDFYVADSYALSNVLSITTTPV